MNLQGQHSRTDADFATRWRLIKSAFSRGLTDGGDFGERP
jgi:hypothetical protein